LGVRGKVGSPFCRSPHWPGYDWGCVRVCLSPVPSLALSLIENVFAWRSTLISPQALYRHFHPKIASEITALMLLYARRVFSGCGNPTVISEAIEISGGVLEMPFGYFSDRYLPAVIIARVRANECWGRCKNSAATKRRSSQHCAKCHFRGPER
jgi:hypothetical protein